MNTCARPSKPCRYHVISQRSARTWIWIWIFTQLRRGEVDEAALREFLQHNEFNSWLRELGAEEPSRSSKTEPDYTTVMDMAGFNKWLKKLEKAELIAFDTETTSLDPMQAELVGLSFAVDPFEAIYIPVGHNYPGAPAQLDRDTVLEALRPLLEGKTHQKGRPAHQVRYERPVTLQSRGRGRRL